MHGDTYKVAYWTLKKSKRW